MAVRSAMQKCIWGCLQQFKKNPKEKKLTTNYNLVSATDTMITFKETLNINYINKVHWHTLYTLYRENNQNVYTSRGYCCSEAIL